MANEIRRRLIAATGADHANLEGRLDIFSRIATTSGRRDLVARFFSLHAGAEAVLTPLLSGLVGLDFTERRRTPFLQRDLAALGVQTLPAPVIPEPCTSAAQALGMLYVLEGSTLGGKTIRRQVEAEGGDMAGLSFLDPYGARGGERWRSFLEVLERETEGPGACADAIDGALAGFRHAEHTLCGCEVISL